MINKIKTFIGKHPKFFTPNMVYVYFTWICFLTAYSIENPIAADMFYLASIGFGISSIIAYFKNID